MSAMDDKTSRALVQKMFQLEAAYREISDKDKELMKYRLNGDSRDGRESAPDPRDKEITKLKYQVSRLEERLNVCKTEEENAKRGLKHAQDGRVVVDKKVKSLEKENRELRNTVSQMRVKLGVASANYNVGKHETENLRKSQQENQILIARLEERLNAANQELERLRNPANPEGFEERKKKINTEKKELKRLRDEVERLEDLRKVDIQRVNDREEENKQLMDEISRNRKQIVELETSLEIAQMTADSDQASREEFERENVKLRAEKQHFDDTLKEYKVRLGISMASKNVNVRQAEMLKQKDEEYQFRIQSLEKRLKAANAEIERMRDRAMETGKTADSLQDHHHRMKKHRNSVNMEFITPRSLDNANTSRSGWTPKRGSPVGSRDRISMGSTGSVNSRYNKLPKIKISSKQGRVSAPR
ncbi:cingulin-like [Mya arenaria]|uniref:cingulin-like n=1 Tax=Mya arenaria TaxID=6604 RepID=UPI0022E82551|nr:cingulin-like [Mya arenaria]